MNLKNSGVKIFLRGIASILKTLLGVITLVLAVIWFGWISLVCIAVIFIIGAIILGIHIGKKL